MDIYTRGMVLELAELLQTYGATIGAATNGNLYIDHQGTQIEVGWPVMGHERLYELAAEPPQPRK